MSQFQGHGITELFFNLFWPIFLLVLFWLFPRYLPNISWKSNLLDALKGWIILMILPNSTYAFFEIKHLFLFKESSPYPNLASYLVFGGISLIGLVTTLYLNVFLVRHYAKTSDQVLFALLFLSLANGFGAVVGLLDIYSYQAILNPLILFGLSWKIVTTPYLLFISVLASLFIYVLTLSFVRLNLAS